MALLDAAKDQLNAALATAQAQVGQFLMQKSRILGLPQTLAKQTLLDENAAIQTRATDVVGKGTALKTQLDAFDTMSFSSYPKIPAMVSQATSLGGQLISLKGDMSNHVAKVDQATTGVQAPGSAAQAAIQVPGVSASSAKIVGTLLVGGAAYAAWRKWRK
jgi:hypothetical protein